MKQKSAEEKSLKEDIEKICWVLCVFFISIGVSCCKYKAPEENIVEQLGDSIFAVYIHTELYDSAERKVHAAYRREVEKIKQEMMYGGYALHIDEYQLAALMKEKIKESIEKEVTWMETDFANDTLNKNPWFLSILANCKEEYIMVSPPVNLENVNLYDISFLDFVFVGREELDRDGNPVNYELVIP